jgi:hypothetical protein
MFAERARILSYLAVLSAVFQRLGVTELAYPEINNFSAPVMGSNTAR